MPERGDSSSSNWISSLYFRSNYYLRLWRHAYSLRERSRFNILSISLSILSLKSHQDNLAAFRCSFLIYLRNSLYWSFSHVRSQTANARLTPCLNACLFLTNENVNRSLLLSLTKSVDPNIKKNLMYFNLFHQPPLLQTIYTVIDVDFLFLRFI